MRKFVNKWSRKLHRWGAILTAIPVIVILCTGVLLQFKKEKHALGNWIQPPTLSGASGELSVSFDAILAAARTVPEAAIESWDDVDRLDVRPGKGVVKVRANNRWEVQIDTSNAEVIHVAYRRSDLIEAIHDGSFFHDKAKIWVFLPAGAILVFLWVSGIYLWILPIWSKRAGRKRRLARGLDA